MLGQCFVYLEEVGWGKDNLKVLGVALGKGVLKKSAPSFHIQSMKGHLCIG